MGVDAMVTLSYEAQVQDVAKVLAILRGVKPVWFDYRSNTNRETPDLVMLGSSVRGEGDRHALCQPAELL